MSEEHIERATKELGLLPFSAVAQELAAYDVYLERIFGSASVQPVYGWPAQILVVAGFFDGTGKCPDWGWEKLILDKYLFCRIVDYTYSEDLPTREQLLESVREKQSRRITSLPVSARQQAVHPAKLVTAANRDCLIEVRLLDRRYVTPFLTHQQLWDFLTSASSSLEELRYYEEAVSAAVAAAPEGPTYEKPVQIQLFADEDEEARCYSACVSDAFAVVRKLLEAEDASFMRSNFQKWL